MEFVPKGERSRLRRDLLPAHRHFGSASSRTRSSDAAPDRWTTEGSRLDAHQGAPCLDQRRRPLPRPIRTPLGRVIRIGTEGGRVKPATAILRMMTTSAAEPIAGHVFALARRTTPAARSRSSRTGSVVRIERVAASVRAAIASAAATTSVAPVVSRSASIAATRGCSRDDSTLLSESALLLANLTREEEVEHGSDGRDSG